jgi:phospholipid/cholesterol/gamma-HCH transport system permease protein
MGIRGSLMTTMEAAVRRNDDLLIVDLVGDWDLEHPLPRFHSLIEGSPQDSAVQGIEFDSSRLGRWDSSLLTFLLQTMTYCGTQKIEFRDTNLPKEIAQLLRLASEVPERTIEADPAAAGFLTRVGARGLSVIDGFMEAIAFTGSVAHGLGRLAGGRARWRWRDFWVVVQANTAAALPIVTLIAFLVGMIISFLGAVVLRRFGAGYFVSYLVGYGVLREMAALMTGIIMAGRTGAAFAAELGSMKITEEIDALRTLGISPVNHLVLPRFLGLLVAMPLLTMYAAFVGILGGMTVAITVLDLSPVQFTGGLLSAVTLSDALLGVFKGTVFGAIIGIAGCMRGMQTGSDAGAVGRSATSAVVLGITLIIAANAVIDWLAVLLDI